MNQKTKLKMKMKQIYIDLAFIFVIISISILSMYLLLYRVSDKWIERADTIKVLTPINLNDSVYYAERAVYDGADYILSCQNKLGNKAYLFTSAKNWHKIKRGEMVLMPYNRVDKSYNRIYKKIK